MGRLEDAMRRAAADKTDRGADLVVDMPFDSGAAGTVDVDAFPSEASATQAPVHPQSMTGGAPASMDAREVRPVEPVTTPVAVKPAGPAQTPTMRALTEAIDSPVLTPGLQTKTVADDEMAPEAREQYRRLAAALHQAQRTTGFKVAMVASAVAGEGKSLTAANIALTLSRSYRRSVLLVDADLRRPSQHNLFQVQGTPGLTEGLSSLEEPHLPLHKVSDRLTVLPAGRPTSDPIGALTSERMRRLLDEAREVFDWIIIDTPPVGLMTDAALLTAMADGVVLVVKAGSTPYDLVQRAVEAIGRERIVGTVLNQAKEQQHSSRYEYYRYYGDTTLPAVRQ